MGSLKSYPGVRRIHIPPDGFVTVYVFRIAEYMHQWMKSGGSMDVNKMRAYKALPGDYTISKIATMDEANTVIYIRTYDTPQVHKDGYTYRAWAISVYAGNTEVGLYP